VSFRAWAFARRAARRASACAGLAQCPDPACGRRRPPVAAWDAVGDAGAGPLRTPTCISPTARCPAWRIACTAETPEAVRVGCAGGRAARGTRPARHGRRRRPGPARTHRTGAGLAMSAVPPVY